MAKRFPIRPLHPERVCWGCDQYCPSDALKCGNGTVRTPHPVEVFGDDWMDWGLDAGAATTGADAPRRDADGRPAGREGAGIA
ncbi:DUF3079 domain-containing protein [Tepidimonas charontis]|uniref:DUF3079 domain-containing protein n=1 Tax=Tepidimonas charontis TaxID=2267262 RepID=A0A554X0A7_9BURK|nr:DUF3079 domain-containing protein [Tepidimonas charontis]TSE29291.1 hypothetical protein Tchar_02600 [Tepidimonas charontis]